MIGTTHLEYTEILRSKSILSQYPILLGGKIIRNYVTIVFCINRSSGLFDPKIFVFKEKFSRS